LTIIEFFRKTRQSDVSGTDKRRLRVNDLLARFEDLRRADLLDESAAEMLKRNYV
jgi:putative tryptophan/tyrosine transport system ATP-binding protein